MANQVYEAILEVFVWCFFFFFLFFFCVKNMCYCFFSGGKKEPEQKTEDL